MTTENNTRIRVNIKLLPTTLQYLREACNRKDAKRHHIGRIIEQLVIQEQLKQIEK